MELNSHKNPLLKQGTILPTGKGGLTKKGGGLEVGTNNPLGIKTFKSHKIWKIEEDFQAEKVKVAKQEEFDYEGDESDELSESELYSDKVINERLQTLITSSPKSDSSVGRLMKSDSSTKVSKDLFNLSQFLTVIGKEDY